MVETKDWSSRVVAAGLLLLAVACFTLSFDALRELAMKSGIRERLAFLFPVIVDGFIVMSTVVALRSRHGGRASALFAWATLTLFAVGSVVGNALHATNAELEVSVSVAATVSAVPPIALLLGTHLLMIESGRRSRPDQPAAVEGAVGDEVVSVEEAASDVTPPALDPVAANLAPTPPLSEEALVTRVSAPPSSPGVVSQGTTDRERSVGSQPAPTVRVSSGGALAAAPVEATLARSDGPVSPADQREWIVLEILRGAEPSVAEVMERFGASDRQARRRLTEARAAASSSAVHPSRRGLRVVDDGN